MDKTINFRFLHEQLRRFSSRANLPRVRTILVSSVVAAFCLLLMTPPGYQQQTGKKTGKDDPRYYDRLLDSIFRDVEQVMQLGMDYALTYKDRLEHDFLEWTAGRDMKNPEDSDYFHAIEVLHDGWKLLLRSAEMHHEARLRQTNDATTERLRNEAEQLRKQGVAKVRDAYQLKKAADEKRADRQAADRRRIDREKQAAAQGRANEVRDVAAQLDQVNTEEAKERDLHNAEIAKASSAPNPRRQTLLRQEDARHKRQMDEIEQRRGELERKLVEMNSPEGRKTPADDWVPPDVAGGDKQSADRRTEIVGGERHGDECFLPPPKKYDSCAATLNKENDRWQAEVAEHDRAVKAETERHNRRMRALDDGRSNGPQVQKETDCHAKRAEQLEAEQDALQERHLKCFNILMIQEGKRP